jgi:hypothetical protein
MARVRKKDAEAAWARIEALGGHGVWEPDMVVVDLEGTSITDDDLELFEHFPFVQILNLSRTAVSDVGLKKLVQLSVLQMLLLKETRISDAAIEEFRQSHPNVDVRAQSGPQGKINPLAGELY